MRTVVGAAIALCFLPASAAWAQYEAPAHAVEPAAHLAEMVALYDEVCLQTFPDDAKVIQAMEARHATPLSNDDVRRYLGNDPGQGWRFDGATTATYVVTIERPPYHACGVRSMTAGAFPDIQPYRDVIARFEDGRHVSPVPPMSATLPNHVQTAGGADQVVSADGSADLLIFFVNSMADGYRVNGQTGVEVRFVRQQASSGRQR